MADLKKYKKAERLKPASKAERAYESYRDHKGGIELVEGKNRPLPPWTKLSESTQAAWRAAVDVVEGKEG